MNIIFLNNQFLSPAEAQISISDRGFLLGDGLFETMRIHQGKVVYLDLHFLRLLKGAKTLAIPLLYSAQQLNTIITTLLEKNNLAANDAIVRLTLTRGESPRGLAPAENPKPTLLIATFPYQPNSKIYKLIVSSIRRNEFSPLANIKSVNYLDNILAYQQARKQNADDALLLNTRDQVACATSANIFMVKDNILFTPKTADGALPGIMRAVILQKAADLKIVAQEISITLAELQAADEVFLANSVQGLSWVAQIDDGIFNKNPANSNIMQKLISSLSSA